MSLLATSQRKLSLILSATIVWLSLFSGVAQAGVISTAKAQQATEQTQQVQVDREQLLQLLDKEDVQAKLIDMGVDIDQAKERVKQLSNEELLALNNQIDDLPAGGSVLGLLVLIFIVFIITDVIGATDIFPFVKPVN